MVKYRIVKGINEYVNGDSGTVKGKDAVVTLKNRNVKVENAIAK